MHSQNKANSMEQSMCYNIFIIEGMIKSGIKNTKIC